MFFPGDPILAGGTKLGTESVDARCHGSKGEQGGRGAVLYRHQDNDPGLRREGENKVVGLPSELIAYNIENSDIGSG